MEFENEIINSVDKCICHEIKKTFLSLNEIYLTL